MRAVWNVYEKPIQTKPTFWDGVASLYDLYNIRSCHLDYHLYSDFQNIRQDFNDVGKDFYYAIKYIDIDKNK